MKPRAVLQLTGRIERESGSCPDGNAPAAGRAPPPSSNRRWPTSVRGCCAAPWRAATPEDLAAIQPLSRAAPVIDVTAEDLEAAERVLEPLEWQRRTRRALDLAAPQPGE